MNKPFSWELLELDTALFGFKTAKIIQLGQEQVSSLIAELQKNKVRYATYRVPSTDIALLHELEKNMFCLVDILVSLQTSIREMTVITDSHIVDASISDIRELKQIASLIFQFSRFHNDPLIPNEKANELFALWIENSVQKKAADDVLVYKDKGRILGFITLQKTGHIPLIGVAPQAQGIGIAQKLLLAALHTFKKRHTYSIHIETQLQNLPAVRSYLTAGFKLTKSHITYRWSNLYT